MHTTVHADEFGCKPYLDTDATPAVAAALRHCRSVRSPVLTFKPGIYHFHADRAAEQFLFISNNDPGLKRIIFPLCEFEDLTIDGSGAEFVFHGMVLPFLVENTRNVSLRQLKIDWSEPLLCQTTVVGAAEGSMDLQIPEAHSYSLENGRLMICGEGWKHPLRGLLEMDPVTGAPAYQSGDHCGAPWNSTFACEEIAPRTVRIRNKFTVVPKIGNVVILATHVRSNPAVYVKNAAETLLESIDLYQAPAMAVIAERSTGITLRSCRVVPRPDSGRLFSATADATHFVNCKGTIELTGCTFECQLDDAVNIHGIYPRIEELASPASVLVRLSHEQQKGAVIAGPGDRVRLVRKGTMAPYAEVTVSQIETINADLSVVTFDQSISRDVENGDLMENITWVPDVIIRDCVARKNRARGFLISTPGKVLIEKNTFSPGGCAVLIAGEGDFWFESGAVSDVVIRGNTFEDCCYGPWSRGVVDITPSVRMTSTEPEFYHRNITIESNTFKTFDNCLLFAYCTDGIRFNRNRISRSQSYKPYSDMKHALVFEACAGIEVCGNKLPARAKDFTASVDKLSQKTFSMAEGQNFQLDIVS